jgi:hypothetical protein
VLLGSVHFGCAAALLALQFPQFVGSIRSPMLAFADWEQHAEVKGAADAAGRRVVSSSRSLLRDAGRIVLQSNDTGREIYMYYRYITGRYISPGPLPCQDAFGASWRMVLKNLASFRTHRAAAARTPPPQPCTAEVAFVALAATDICAMLGFLVAFLWLLYRTGVRLRRMDYGATRYHQVSEFLSPD